MDSSWSVPMESWWTWDFLWRFKEPDSYPATTLCLPLIPWKKKVHFCNPKHLFTKYFTWIPFNSSFIWVGISKNMFPVACTYWWKVEKMALEGWELLSVVLFTNPYLWAMASLNRNSLCCQVDSGKASKISDWSSSSRQSVLMSIKIGPRTGSDFRVTGRAKGSEAEKDTFYLSLG